MAHEKGGMVGESKKGGGYHLNRKISFLSRMRRIKSSLWKTGAYISLKIIPPPPHNTILFSLIFFLFWVLNFKRCKEMFLLLQKALFN